MDMGYLGGGPAHPHAASALLRKGLLRLASGLVAAALLFWLTGAAAGLPDPASVAAALAGIPASSWAAAAALTAISYLAASDYDRVIHAALRTGIAPSRARRSGFAAIAVAQLTGMGPVAGTFVRWMTLPELGFAAAARISAVVALSFMAGWALVTAAAIALAPPGPVAALAPVAAAVLALCGLAGLLVAFRPRALRIRAWTALLALTAIDTVAAGTAFAALLGGPAAPAQALAPYLAALGAGLLIATPAGLGGFDSALFALIPGADAAGLVAALFAYRLVYILVPAALALPLVLRGALGSGRSGMRGMTRLAPPHAAPSAARFAEAGPAESLLVRQGHLGIFADGAVLWLAAPAGAALVALGPPAGTARGVAGPAPAPRRQEPPASRFHPAAGVERRRLATPAPDHPDLPGAGAGARRAIRAFARAARAEGRFACLYKATPRLACAARAMGYRVLPVAREAVIRPDRFAPESPACATLRRKLRRARRDGIRVRRAGDGQPWAELAEVNRLWSDAHGGERGFSTGRFAPGYLAGQAVWLARDATGGLAGFVTFHTARAEWTVDLMRQRPGAPDGTMHSLIAAAIADAAAAGVPRLSLAAAPLAAGGWAGRAARLLAWLVRRDRGAGLAQFKQCFAPAWEPRYIAAPGALALLRAGLAISREILRPAPLPAGAGSEGGPQTPAGTAPESAPPLSGAPEAAAEKGASAAVARAA
ncbi:MAG: phosphatidylglycerol lysyltransferase domain-containing protein [Paracoccaceae bacterium]